MPFRLPLGAGVVAEPANVEHSQRVQTKENDDNAAHTSDDLLVHAEYLAQQRRRAASTNAKNKRKAQDKQSGVPKGRVTLGQRGCCRERCLFHFQSSYLRCRRIHV